MENLVTNNDLQKNLQARIYKTWYANDIYFIDR